MNNKNITLSKEIIHKKQGVVILSLREYEKLRESAMSTCYLEGRGAKELDKLIEQGIKECQKGKCKTIKSLEDLD